MEAEKRSFFDEAMAKYSQLEDFLGVSVLELCKKYCNENGDICRAKKALSDENPILLNMKKKDDYFKETLCAIERLHFEAPDLIYVCGHSYDKEDFALGWHSMKIIDKILVLYWFKKYVEK